MTKLIRIPFADNGDKVEVPLTQQDDGSVSYAQGYTLNYELDPNTDASAKRVERTKMNQLFNDVTVAIRELQVNGVAPWITAADNGGSAFPYSTGAVVGYSGNVYQSVVDNNTSTPGTDLNWSRLSKANEKRQETITASRAFLVPGGVTVLYLSGCAGGGGGGAGGGGNQSFYGAGGAGGGAGQAVIKRAVNVTPGQSLYAQIGTAGSGGIGNSGGGTGAGDGGVTSLGSLLTLQGGNAGGNGGNTSSGGIAGATNSAGYPGGSAGGDGALSQGSAMGGNGGSGPFGGGGGGSRASFTIGLPAGSAYGYGAGGGGGGGHYSGGGDDQTAYAGGNGGAGAPGILIIEW